MLRIAVSSRSLFHMEDGNKIYQEQGQDAFNKYMQDKEQVPLRPGVAFPLVQKLLGLNGHLQSGNRVEVVLLSRNSPDAGMRVMNSVDHYGLDIEQAAFSQGTNRFRYAQAMGAQLFLSANSGDVQSALAHGIAAATMLPAERDEVTEGDAVRIAFDGDAVLFSDEADQLYRERGLEAFRQSERDNATVPLGAGPFKAFLLALHELQQHLPKDLELLRVAIVTARGMPSHGRVINTLRHWGIKVDEAIFAAGRAKGPLLRAFGADVFFDDTMKNIDSANTCDVTSGHVPFGTGQGIVAEEPKSLSPGHLRAV